MSSAPPPGRDDTPMTRTYVAVVVIEAVILAFLFLLGRIYS